MESSCIRRRRAEIFVLQTNILSAELYVMLEIFDINKNSEFELTKYDPECFQHIPLSRRAQHFKRVEC